MKEELRLFPMQMRPRTGNLPPGGAFAPSIEILKGRSRLWRPEPKTKGNCESRPFVLEGAVKIDILD